MMQIPKMINYKTEIKKYIDLRFSNDNNRR